MPIYEYQCDNCKHIFEELIFNSQDRAKPNICCPKCHKKKVNLLYSTFGLKGVDKKVAQSNCSSCSAKSCSGCK
ncbi:MAG: zinc ribbon domain-containing protein [candidate division WOR-3 bacterium]|nr:zinc ribbon domain-containing protein [candidate division WOR-3 bacterium]